MPRRPRDYKAEYQRRIARGQVRGLSRSQARGHAKAAEPSLGGRQQTLADGRLQIALRILRRERNIASAAKSAKVSTERLRKLAVERGLIEKDGGRWKLTPTLLRQMPLFSKGRLSVVTVTADEATEVGRFMSTARSFLETNKASLLEPFRGRGVRDKAGKFHPFESNPNALYRLAAGGEASFEQIYRIIT